MRAGIGGGVSRLPYCGYVLVMWDVPSDAGLFLEGRENMTDQISLLTRRSFVKSGTLLAVAASMGGLLSACSVDEPAVSAPSEEGAEVVKPSTPAPESGDAPEPASEAAEVQQEAAAAAPVLVAYYSNTGNTQRIAEMIAGAMDADLFAITPVDEYTSEDTNWRDENSRVSQEMPRRSEVGVELVEVTPPDFDSYKTVFLGYPIWWQSFSWVLNDFVRENDFEGKTVVPFCTSSSSPLGESDQDLAAEAQGGTWLPGERFGGSATEEDVRQWLESLAL